MDRGRSDILAQTVHRPQKLSHFSNTPFENILAINFESAVSTHAMQKLGILWGTKFYTEQGHLPLLIVRLSGLIIRSNTSLNTWRPPENKTYAIPLSSPNQQPMS
jgi:hypothetical protein